jgi:Na+/H+ antiporter NhaD/arsenite permease-like protein
MDTTVVIFLLSYAALAIGRIPGFRVDRTGAVLLGAIALIVSGRIGVNAAWDAVNFSAIALLFGLMVVSATFVLAGFYDWAAARIASLQVGPKTLLAVFIAVSALFSAVLTNDVVVVAMTPLLVQITLSRGLNPLPFLLGFCFAANAGSAGTLIGSPQNMMVAGGLDLSFTAFLKVAAVPALLSLPIVWLVLLLLYRDRWTLHNGRPPSARPAAEVKFDRLETIKATVVTVAVIAAFTLTGWSHAVVALAAAGVLLLNRRIASADMLKHVDGDLLLLLFGLFVLNAALAQTGIPTTAIHDLAAAGLNLHEPMPLLFVSAVLSNVVGNNPAVILLLPYVGRADADLTGAAMALGTGFASNLIIFSSLAGIIVVEVAQRHGIRISFGEFSRAGALVSLACLALAAGWIHFLS